MNKKAMGVGQVFVFIIAALTFSLIMIFGYKSINGLIIGKDQVLFVQFQTDLKSKIKTISTEYGSKRIEQFSVPSKFTQVCFINLDYPKDEIKKELNDLCKKDQVACTVWEDVLNTNIVSGYDSVDENVFLIPSAEVKLKVGRLSMRNENDVQVGYICSNVVKGEFSIVLDGKGDHTELSKAKQMVN